MVFQSWGRSTNFQTPISVSPSNSSWEAASHLLLSSKLIASRYELGTSWNIFANIALILSPEGWGWWANRSLVGQREYWGWGSSQAGSWPNLEGCTPCGTTGGALGGSGEFVIEILMVSMQIDLGWVVSGKVGLGWLVPVPSGLIHYQIQKLAGHSQMPDF